jgi:hypothetical protein
MILIANVKLLAVVHRRRENKSNDWHYCYDICTPPFAHFHTKSCLYSCSCKHVSMASGKMLETNLFSSSRVALSSESLEINRLFTLHRLA